MSKLELMTSVHITFLYSPKIMCVLNSSILQWFEIEQLKQCRLIWITPCDLYLWFSYSCQKWQEQKEEGTFKAGVHRKLWNDSRVRWSHWEDPKSSPGNLPLALPAGKIHYGGYGLRHRVFWICLDDVSLEALDMFNRWSSRFTLCTS